MPRSKASVRRSLHRAVSGLLAHEFGRGQMLAVMADVSVPSAQDERSVMMSPEEIRGALASAFADFRPVVGYMLTTGIDLGPMMMQRVYHYDPQTGTLTVPDTKTAARPRTLALRGEPVLENAEPWIRELVAGRAHDEPLVPLTRNQVRKRWGALRKRIGRPDIRLKDLRGIFATYYLMAGGDPRGLQLILGHTTMAMTLRYLRRLPAGNRALLRTSAAHMGTVAPPRLSVERGAVA
jgi:integrase